MVFSVIINIITSVLNLKMEKFMNILDNEKILFIVVGGLEVIVHIFDLVRHALYFI